MPREALPTIMAGMELPIIHLDLKGQRYDCENCGQGCRELVVYLTERDRKKIDRQKWEGRLDRPPYIRFGRSLVLNHRPNGDCVFLTPDNLCRIHAEFGYPEKPLSCQLFPFSIEPEGQGFRVTVRFDCPAMAKSVGRPLAAHRSDVARITGALQDADLPELAQPRKPVYLRPGSPLTASELDGLVERTDAWMGDRTRPLRERLAGLENLVETLSTARLTNVQGEDFTALVDLLVSDLPNAVEELRQRPLPPLTPRQLKLFRHTVFAHCENLRLEEACAGLRRRWSYRFDQLRRARRLAAGAGEIPRMIRGHAGGTFEQLEPVQRDESLPTDACDAMLTRYLRARLAGRTAFGHGYFGWPVLEGLRALMLAIAVTGWVARYAALGEGRSAFNYGDLVRAIGIVDRNATRSPELGLRSARMRLQYLSPDHGILRLLDAYPLA